MGKKAVISLFLFFFITCKFPSRSLLDEKYYTLIHIDTFDFSEIYVSTIDSSWKIKKTYWDDHTIMSRVFYFKSRKEGPFELFHPNGKIASRGVYKNNCKINEFVNYDENGRLESKQGYKEDKLLYRIYFDSLGNISDTIRL